MDRVRLYTAPTAEWAWLRELSGAEEQQVRGTATPDALDLLDQLLVDGKDQCVRPGEAAQLTAVDRDRLLAAVFTRIYGTRIENTLRCAACGALYDIDFSLDDLLVSRVQAEVDESVGESVEKRLEDGSFRLPDGTRFRLPTGEDECAVLGIPLAEAEQRLLDRCLIERGAAELTDREFSTLVQETLEAVAPTLDIELDTVCAECGTHHPARFDIQHYLLSALQQERPRLDHEIHLLASTYGWSLGEILGLPRSQRRSLVALVVAEHSPARRELS